MQLIDEGCAIALHTIGVRSQRDPDETLMRSPVQFERAIATLTYHSDTI
ncbi:hypothetical protein [Microseira wollei]|nr:hypothetical protein [Microseira wollei]